MAGEKRAFDSVPKFQPPKRSRFKEVAVVDRPDATCPGRIRVLKIYSRFADVDPDLRKWPGDPVRTGYVCHDGEEWFRVNVCKQNKFGDRVSPMRLGPPEDYATGRPIAHNVEDAWQGAKVWPSMVKDPDWIGAFMRRYYDICFSGEAKRHRVPTADAGYTDPESKNRNAPLFSYVYGALLGYMPARELTYVRRMEDLLRGAPAFEELVSRHRAGENLMLLEYDGLDRGGAHDVDLSAAKVRELLDDAERMYAEYVAEHGAPRTLLTRTPLAPKEGVVHTVVFEPEVHRFAQPKERYVTRLLWKFADVLATNK